MNEAQGKVHAGHQSIDFQTSETGLGRKQLTPDKTFVITFHVGDGNVTHVTIRREKTSLASHAGPAPVEDAGAVGLFVKSGTVIIKAIDVQDEP